MDNTKVDEESQGLETSDEQANMKFSPEEEQSLLDESQKLKTEANLSFVAAKYEEALAKYGEAIQVCPNYLHYERAVLQSNIAAGHLQLEQWKEAIKSATTALDSLKSLETETPELAERKIEENKKHDSETQNERVVEIEEEVDAEDTEGAEAVGDATTQPKPASDPAATEARKADIRRIRTKALLRRARGRAEAGGWQNYAGAEEDYKALAQTPGLTPADLRTVKTQLRTLPPKTKAAQEKEMGEMWGKLRQLGDGILKPFGMSTDNFKMVQDEKTGGYSVNFSQEGAPPK